MIDEALIVPLVHPITMAVISDKLGGDGSTPNSLGFTPLDRLGHYFFTHLSRSRFREARSPARSRGAHAEARAGAMRLVDIKGLKVEFAQHGGVVQAVRGISLHVDEGESLGIVGESGSGKSVTFLALHAIARRNRQSHRRVHDARWRRCSPRRPPHAVGNARQVRGDGVPGSDDRVRSGLHHRPPDRRDHPHPPEISKREAMAEAEHLLRRVEIGNAADVLGYYPHQMSGGMLQRAMIAMALSCRPKLLIADEPTTALDVTIQAQILQLIKELQAEFGMALVMITHDLGVIAETVDRVVVMYGGRVMEQGPVQQIFDAPTHSYTQSLLQSLRAGETRQQRDARRLPRRRSSFAACRRPIR